MRLSSRPYPFSTPSVCSCQWHLFTAETLGLLRHAQAFNFLVGVYLAYSLAIIPDHPIRQPWTQRDVIGAALAWGGLGLRWWSQTELGSLFTFVVGIRKGHKLVQSGPYAVLRHPSYTGLAVGLVGIALFLRSAALTRLQPFIS